MSEIIKYIAIFIIAVLAWWSINSKSTTEQIHRAIVFFTTVVIFALIFSNLA